MITALHLLAIKRTGGKRHATMRAGVAQCKSFAVAIASDYQGNFEQHGFMQPAPFDHFRRKRAIPEAGEHQGIRGFALEGLGSCHWKRQRNTRPVWVRLPVWVGHSCPTRMCSGGSPDPPWRRPREQCSTPEWRRRD